MLICTLGLSRGHLELRLKETKNRFAVHANSCETLKVTASWRSTSDDVGYIMLIANDHCQEKFKMWWRDEVLWWWWWWGGWWWWWWWWWWWRDRPQDDDDDDEDQNGDDGNTQRQNDPQRINTRLVLNNIRRLAGHRDVDQTLHGVERLTERRR